MKEENHVGSPYSQNSKPTSLPLLPPPSSIQVEDLQLTLENGRVLALNEVQEVQLRISLEQALRGKMRTWRHSEAANSAKMEDWRNQRDVMQEVRRKKGGGGGGGMMGSLCQSSQSRAYYYYYYYYYSYNALPPQVLTPPPSISMLTLYLLLLLLLPFPTTCTTTATTTRLLWRS